MYCITFMAMFVSIAIAPPPGSSLLPPSPSLDYNPLERAHNDPSDRIVFGFLTDNEETSRFKSAPKATIIIDLYDTNEGFIYRCYHRGVTPRTVYSCTDGDDNVMKLSTTLYSVSPFLSLSTGVLSTEGIALALRAFEFDGMHIESVFFSTAKTVIGAEQTTFMKSADQPWSNSIKVIYYAFGKAYDRQMYPYYRDWMEDMQVSWQFAIDVVRTNHYGYTLNNIDTDIGITKQALTVAPSEIKEAPITYNAQMGECNWKSEKLEESINAVDPGNAATGIAGGMFDGANAVGNCLSVAGDMAKIAGNVGKVASLLGPVGNIMKAGNAIFDIVGVFVDMGPSQAELTQTAMTEMTKSMDNMMDCTREYTDFKVDALRKYVDAKIKRLQDDITQLKKEFESNSVQLEQKIDAKILEATYKTHIENVEQEIATIEDILKACQTQLGMLETLNEDDKMAQLRSILANTIPRFASAFKTKPTNTEFDYFWRVYSREMPLYIMEVMALRIDVYTMWLYYNTKTNPDLDVKSITPDYHVVFRDLSGELIGEYLELLPLAINVIIQDGYKVDAVQRLSTVDQFSEINLRLKPHVVCAWIRITQSFSDTSTATFLGAKLAPLYDDDWDKCAANIGKYVIGEAIRVDNAQKDGGIYHSADDDTYYTSDFIIQPANFASEKTVSGFFRFNIDLNSINTDSKVFKSGSGFNGLQLSVTSIALHGTVYAKNPQRWMVSEIKVSSPENADIGSGILLAELYDVQKTWGPKKVERSCSLGYVMSGIRFAYWNDFDLAGFKLLCRPIPKTKSNDYLFKTFTDFEIVGATTDDANGKTMKYLEWQKCPIGKIIKHIEFKYSYDSGNMYLNGEMRIRCGSITNFKYYTLIHSNSYYFDYYVKPYKWQIIAALFVFIFAVLSYYIYFIQRKIKNQYKKIKSVDVDDDCDLEDCSA